jgi:penicillin-binding protein 2
LGGGGARVVPRRLQVPGAKLRGLGSVTDEDAGEQKKQARIGLRLTITAVIVLGLFTVMVGRLWTLQVLQTKTFKKAEITTSTRQVPLTPLRGLIFARGGQLLVSNRVLAVVTLSRDAVVNQPWVIPRLASLLGMTVAQVNYQVNNPIYNVLRPVPVLIGATMEQVIYISEHPKYLPGVAVSYEAERSYPAGDVNPTLIGFVGDITSAELKQPQFKGYDQNAVVGQFGVEASFERWLRGTPGSQTLVVDPAGDVLGVERSKTIPAQPGDSVILSVDLGLQHELDQALASQVQSLRAGTRGHAGVAADWAAAVVEDPQNGQILAMSSVDGPKLAHDQTFSISGYSPPGSTFKLVTATAALDSGLISQYSPIDDPGFIQLCNPPSNTPGCILHNSPGETPAGQGLTITPALARSDDVFFYTLGADFYRAVKQYGTTPIQDMAARYGLGKYSNIDIPGEGGGQVDNPTMAQYTCGTCGYYLGDQVEMAFGQGATEITALQLANAYATFANGGTRYQPQIAAATVNPRGVVRPVAPIVDGHVSLPASTEQPILQGLEGAVYSSIGTAQATFAGYKGFPIAGKTGTASTFGNRQPNGLFVAFGPCSSMCAPTEPKYVVAVIVDQAGYGAQTAAPVALSVFNYLNKHPVQQFAVPAHPTA